MSTNHWFSVSQLVITTLGFKVGIRSIRHIDANLMQDNTLNNATTNLSKININMLQDLQNWYNFVNKRHNYVSSIHINVDLVFLMSESPINGHTNFVPFLYLCTSNWSQIWENFKQINLPQQSFMLIGIHLTFRQILLPK